MPNDNKNVVDIHSRRRVKMKVYAPEDFVVPGRDNHGNSVKAVCRISPDLNRSIDVIFENHKFPFRVKGDLVRWCIKTGVDQLEFMEPNADSVMNQTNAMMDTIREEDRSRAYMTVFHRLGATVSAHMKDGDNGRAKFLVYEMYGHIQKMDEGFWKSRYLRELDNRFGHLLRGEGVGLGDHIDSGPDQSGVDEDDPE